MRIKVIFVGNKFVYNKHLQEYCLRKIEEKNDFVHSVIFFKDSDHTLFLELERELEMDVMLIIITIKQNFTTIGKLISTITCDNQVLEDNMLIPQKSSVYEDGSYLLKYKNSFINVLHIDEMQKLPQILIETKQNKAILNIFEEEQETFLAIVNPLAQTHDIKIEVTKIIDGWLRIDIFGKKYGNLSKFINSIKNLFSNKIIASSNIVVHIIEKLYANNKTISFAESCTGGLLTYFFTKNNGASKILNGSLVTYSNELKENWLAVENSVIENNGAVSFEVVEQMSDGVLNVSEADYAISVSGIAGDGGGTEEKPVGTVFVGVRTKDFHQEYHLQLFGDRNYVQQQSVLYGLKYLLLADKETFFEKN